MEPTQGDWSLGRKRLGSGFSHHGDPLTEYFCLWVKAGSELCANYLWFECYTSLSSSQTQDLSPKPPGPRGL